MLLNIISKPNPKKRKLWFLNFTLSCTFETFLRVGEGDLEFPFKNIAQLSVATKVSDVFTSNWLIFGSRPVPNHVSERPNID